MKFGLALDFGTQRTTLDRVVADFRPSLRLAEQFGFDAVIAGETYPSGPGFSHIPSPLLVLASLAPQTSLRLGTGVTLLPSWQPLKLAYDCAVLDQLSGGRFTLGIDVANPPDWRRFGLDHATAARRFDETPRALKALWSGQPGYAGEIIKIGQGIQPLPVQPGGPPILVGGQIPRAARRAAELGDGWYAATQYRFSLITSLAARYRQALAAAGQDPTTGSVAANRLTYVAESATDLDAGRPNLARVLKSYARMGSLRVDSADPAGEAIAPDAPDLFDRAAPEICCFGTPDQVADQIGRYAAAGVTHLQLRIAPGDLPAGLVARTVRLLGEHVLPRFRAGSAAPGR